MRAPRVKRKDICRGAVLEGRKAGTVGRQNQANERRTLTIRAVIARVDAGSYCGLERSGISRGWQVAFPLNVSEISVGVRSSPVT